MDIGLTQNITVFIAALFFLIFGAEVAVKRAIALLHHLGWSQTFGGLVMFSVSTSLPEIFAHITASVGILRGTLDYKIASATVFGANIGSDVVQQTLVLGIVVIMLGGLTFNRVFLLTAYLPMIGTTLLTLLLGLDRTISRLDGAILLGTFVIYMLYLRKKEQGHVYEKQTKIKDGHLVSHMLMVLVAFVIIATAAHFLLVTTESLVAITGVGGSLIGVVSIGIVSAAPELFTAITGVLNNAKGISLGTLIGSNITNPLVAIGGGALISTYWAPYPLLAWDLPMETITAAILLIYLMFTKGKLSRWGGVYLVGLYIVYVVIRIMFFAID